MAIKQIQGKPYTIYEGGTEKSSSEKEKKKIGHRLPEFELLSTDLPEVKDWKIGNKVLITLEVSPISINNTDKSEVMSDYSPSGENDDEKKDKEEIVVARVEITGVKVEEKTEDKKEKKDVFGEMKGGANRIG